MKKKRSTTGILFMLVLKHPPMPEFSLFQWNYIVEVRCFSLKKLVKDYKVVKYPSSIKSHSWRKSFGRCIFENNDNSEKSLILLGKMFNHSNISMTKMYLDIRDKKIQDVYDNLLTVCHLLNSLYVSGFITVEFLYLCFYVRIFPNKFCFN